MLGLDKGDMDVTLSLGRACRSVASSRKWFSALGRLWVCTFPSQCRCICVEVEMVLAVEQLGSEHGLVAAVPR